jgi:hypothetical protein
MAVVSMLGQMAIPTRMKCPVRMGDVYASDPPNGALHMSVN